MQPASPGSWDVLRLKADHQLWAWVRPVPTSGWVLPSVHMGPGRAAVVLLLVAFLSPRALCVVDPFRGPWPAGAVLQSPGCCGLSLAAVPSGL